MFANMLLAESTIFLRIYFPSKGRLSLLSPGTSNWGGFPPEGGRGVEEGVSEREVYMNMFMYRREYVR